MTSQMVNMLLLCEAQMGSALQESDHAVGSLIQVFTDLADTMRNVSALSHLDQELAAVSQQINCAIMAFQFYDKLTQRLGHVRYSLNSAAEFICDPAQVQHPEQWQQLHAALRSMYRTAEERELFQLMMDRKDGNPPDDAHQAASVDLKASGTANSRAAGPGDIELF